MDTVTIKIEDKANRYDDDLMSQRHGTTILFEYICCQHCIQSDLINYVS